MNIKLLTVVMLAFFAAGSAAFAQPAASPNPGLELLQAGKYDQAAKAFEQLTGQPKFAGDASIWNYLGLSYSKLKNNKKAAKAFEKSVKIEPQNTIYLANLAAAKLGLGKLDEAAKDARKIVSLDPENALARYIIGQTALQKGDAAAARSTADSLLATAPSFTGGYLLKADVLQAELFSRLKNPAEMKELAGALQGLIENFEQLSKINRTAAESAGITERLEQIRAFYDYARRSGTSGSGNSDSTIKPVKITFMPRAKYADEARNRGLQGIIRVLVVFGADGKIGPIVALNRLGGGLDEMALAAAQQIKFVPKMKDGAPVSTVLMLEYSFAVY